MSSNPWEILEIQPTTDREKIKTAWRTLAQKYHPDKAKTPEKQRSYTIRFVEIRQAYDFALKYADNQLRQTKGQFESPPNNVGATNPMRWVYAFMVLCGVIVAIGLLAVVAMYARTFPDTHPFPVLLVVLLGVIPGYLAGFFLFVFLMPLWLLPSLALEKIGLGKFTDKIGWALSVCLWIYVLYSMGIPAFSVREVGTFSTWAVAFGFPPIFGLWLWVENYIKYNKVSSEYFRLMANPAVVLDTSSK